MERLAINGGKPCREKKIYYGRQWIDEKDISAVIEVLRSEWLTQGPKIAELENSLRLLCQAKHAIACSNGTSALHLACIAAGINEGDEVVTTPFTFVASANCVRYCGGTVVFADIDIKTYNINPAAVRAKITPKTKAVIAVDYAGQPAVTEELYQVCETSGITLIEDAAHGIGGRYHGVPVGGLADITTFSFHPVKAVTGGEGGAVLTEHRRFAERVREYASHGIVKDPDRFQYEKAGEWYYEQQVLGYNFRMSDIQAALIISQIDKITQFKQRRREIVQLYNNAFAGMKGIVTPYELEGAESCWHLYTIRIDSNFLKCSRREFYDALAGENVQPQVHYLPVYLHPYYQELGHFRGECPVAEEIYQTILSLPLYPRMSDTDITDVIRAVKKVYNYYQK